MHPSNFERRRPLAYVEAGYFRITDPYVMWLAAGTPKREKRKRVLGFRTATYKLR